MSVERKISVADTLLDYGSKLMFVNSALSSLLVYTMCSIKIPPKTVEHLDKLLRHCFGTNKQKMGQNTRRLLLGRWCAGQNPSLGIVDIKVQNQALLLKKLFKSYNRFDVPWVKLVWNTYYNQEVPHASDSRGSFWWRDILQLSDIFIGVTRIKVGDGSTTLFCKDLWNEQILCDSHPRAFSFALDEDLTVQKLLLSNSIGEAFHLPLSLQARDEVEPGCDTKDRWFCVWDDTGRKGFAPSEFYKFCFKDIQVDDAFSWIWKSKCTKKWKVFAWLLLADRLNTRNMLR